MEPKRNLLQEFCGNCLYYRPYNDGRRSGGRCHHQPPMRVVLDNGEVAGTFPPVPSQEWCGQWRAHPEGGVAEQVVQPPIQESSTTVEENPTTPEAGQPTPTEPPQPESPAITQRPLSGGTRPAAKVGPKKWHREPEPTPTGLPKELGGNG